MDKAPGLKDVSATTRVLVMVVDLSYQRLEF